MARSCLRLHSQRPQGRRANGGAALRLDCQAPQLVSWELRNWARKIVLNLLPAASGFNTPRPRVPGPFRPPVFTFVPLSSRQTARLSRHRPLSRHGEPDSRRCHGQVSSVPASPHLRPTTKLTTRPAAAPASPSWVCTYDSPRERIASHVPGRVC